MSTLLTVLKPQQLRDTRMQVWSDSRCARNTIPGETTVNTNSTLCAGFLFGNPAACQVSGDQSGQSWQHWGLVGHFGLNVRTHFQQKLIGVGGEQLELVSEDILVGYN